MSMKEAIPEYIRGYGKVYPYNGIHKTESMIEYIVKRRINTFRNDNKVIGMEALLQRLKLHDGITISFHHHLRNGDQVINYILKELANVGVKDITVVSSGFLNVHEELVEYIRCGIIRKIYASYLTGPIGRAISEGRLKEPAVLLTHGGRARKIESGELHIDVAFIAASQCDAYGNMNGKIGKSAFGVLGYSHSDAAFADVVVAVTDNLVPCLPDYIEIGQHLVDYILEMDRIGDPLKIASGTMKITDDPVNLRIAETAATVIEESGYFKDNFTFQTGAGGTSLAVAAFVKDKMITQGIKGGTIVGGTTKYSVDLLQSGLFRKIIDVQCFDNDAVQSIYINPGHMGMSAGMYANPWSKGSVVNNIDVVVLGATEVDVNFNVNVITNSDGCIIGASGGHSDTAAGAKLTVVVTPLVRKEVYPIVLDQVTTLTTPGETVDVIVTDQGVAVNPLRQDLADNLLRHGVDVKPIRELRRIAREITGKDNSVKKPEGRIVAVVEYRDGTVIDVVRQVETKFED